MKQKLENFFYYYKYHVIAVIFVIILIVAIVQSTSTQQIKFVIADDTSQMNLLIAKDMMRDFEKSAGMKEGEAAFYYQSMFISQDDFEDINLGIAGVADYEKCFENGEIDCVINTIENIQVITETEEETKYSYKKLHAVVSLDEIFSKEELQAYEKYIHYIKDTPVGIVFDKCPKAKEYFGDDYPSPNHYILQIAKGAVEKEEVKQFLTYLMTE